MPWSTAAIRSFNCILFAKAVRDYPRRPATDESIKAIGESGGVMSINTVGGFVDPLNADIVTTDILFQHIDHIVNLIGIDHVGYGSDYIPDVTWTADRRTDAVGGYPLFPDSDGTHTVFHNVCREGVPSTFAVPDYSCAGGQVA